MRCCIVVNSAPSHSQTFIQNHIVGLEADVVTQYLGPSLDGDNTASEVRYLHENPKPKRSLVQRLISRIREATIGLSEPTWPEEMEQLWRKYLRDREPDVVLAEFGPNGIRALSGCRDFGIPLVVHFHGYDLSSLLRIRAYRKALRPLVEYASASVIVGSHMIEPLRSVGCQIDDIHLIPCGAQLDKISKSTEVDSRECKFISITRFVEHKGPFETLDAFRICAEEVDGVSLNMIGGGKLLKKSKRWVRNQDLEDQVKIQGYKPWNFAISQLESSSVFIQHSKPTRVGAVEGWGVSLAEGAGAGLPVVSTRIGGIRDQVKHGETGFLIEPGDSESMAETMIELATRPNLRAKMGDEAFRHIKKIGDARKQMKKLRALLVSVSR